MPRYGTFKFGRIAKYGRYTLTTPVKNAVGPHVICRIRTINSNRTSSYLTMCKERAELPAVGNVQRIRIRINSGEWVYSQKEEIVKDTYKVRIRSLSSDGGMSEWVYGDRVNLKSI